MPSYIVKASPDEDFYVVWSTVVDAPCAWGSRAEIEGFYPGKESSPERFDRADENGSSARWPDWPDEKQPFSWTDEGFLLMEVGPRSEDRWYTLPRHNLKAFCERLETDEDGLDTADLLTFELVE